MSMTKHVGRLKNTGTRIAIVYRFLEDEPDNCIICEVERLPDLLHDNVMEIINSKIAQGTVNLYEALSRSQLNDGSNALSALHRAGYFRKVAVEQVEAIPMPNRPVPLSHINEAIANGGNSTTAPDVPAMPKEQSAPAEAGGDASAIAQNLITQAELMEADAQTKRAEAYKLDPSLDPASKTKAKPAEKKKNNN